ncbi:50S ribosomal protein L25/general stress protein Ctc [Desulfofundulus thermocisternus]|uniref:50S ribosomal protein L25/general stress protein Ctc n=1 Tax=Desulfofundulus thermocisternus TaxID=42471 RepID=UPI00217D91B2|nr:50S ribosomal protein L25/general stress protein Ctc [Desulfofundulus thermocisternus]MCS5695398.1 50S ribosomal protein L25/general stress protein Ctc [Desulfofundulus thermocisternus]
MEASLLAQVRSGRGKGYRHRLAAQGKIPAVVYGRTIGSIPLEVELRAVKNILAGEGGRNTLINLKITGDGQERQDKVLIKELQFDNMRGELIHVDFQQVSLTDRVTTTVPVELEGEPVGVKQGGILQQQLRELEISCLPADIPEAITMDVSGLEMGDTIYVSDLPVPEGVKVLNDPEEVVATVVAPAIERVPGEEEEEAGEGKEASPEAGEE